MKKLALILITAALALNFTACNLASPSTQSQSTDKAASSQAPQAALKSTEGTPEYALNSAVEAVRVMDIGAIQKHFVTPEGDRKSTLFDPADLSNESVKAYVEPIGAPVGKNLTCEILESKVEGDTAIVKATIQNIDFSQLVSELITQVLMGQIDPTNLQMDALSKLVSEKLGAIVNDSSAKKFTATLDVSLKKVGSDWKVVADVDLLDAMFGGLIKPIESMVSTAGGALSGLLPS